MTRKQYAPQLPTAAILSVAAALVCLAGCAATLECGSWAFSGTPQSNPDKFSMNSAFTFTPSACGKDCDCEEDVMTQMAWIYDINDRTYIYGGSQDAARTTANGWFIDRVDGSRYGFFGLNNDGVTFESYWNTPGSNGTPNTLYDIPAGLPNNTWFYAVDVATCFKSRTCNNRILGYYFWSWTIDNEGNASKFIIAPAWKDLDSEFQSALTAWNAWALKSGNTMPGQPMVPNGVNFPTLTDL